jgi:hypothetical protein
MLERERRKGGRRRGRGEEEKGRKGKRGEGEGEEGEERGRRGEGGEGEKRKEGKRRKEGEGREREKGRRRERERRRGRRERGEREKEEKGRGEYGPQHEVQYVHIKSTTVCETAAGLLHCVCVSRLLITSFTVTTKEAIMFLCALFTSNKKKSSIKK